MKGGNVCSYGPFKRTDIFDRHTEERNLSHRYKKVTYSFESGSCFFRLVTLLFLLMVGSVCSGKPLEPPEPIDNSSPRATMQSFIALTQETTDRYLEYRDSPSRDTQYALRQTTGKYKRLFDLSQIAPAVRNQVAAETFLLLWDATGRQQLPDYLDIPGTTANLKDTDKPELPERWRIPRTEITIKKITEGPNAGEYRFSAGTVENARSFYEMMRDLPYQQPMDIGNVHRITELLTGWMIPIKWVESLPDWANTSVYGQVLWKWLLMLLLYGLGIGVVVAAYKWGCSKALNGSISSFVRYLSAPMSVLVVQSLLHYFFHEQIYLTGEIAQLSQSIGFLIYGITMVWIVWIFADQVAEFVIASPRVQAESLDASLLRLVSRSVGVVAVLVLVFKVLSDLGVPVAGLITGAGVGGVAVALAAKSTLENFMGALNLFADHPVRVGDLCRYDEESVQGWRPVGTVESIGLRSTRIRRIDGFLITIPNAEFAQRNILNLSSNDRFLLSTVLGLRYETTDDQLRFVLAELRELLHAHPQTIHTASDPIRLRFVEFGEYSLNLNMRVYIRTKHYNEFLAIQEDILLRAMKIVDRAGTGFAFPSRTLYLGRDGGLDPDKQQAAEKSVREWASAHTLPFPDFTDDYRHKIEDTLDYPPEGSPGADLG